MKRCRTLFWASLCMECTAALSLSLLVPFCGDKAILKYIAAGLFWGFMAVGYILLYCADKLRKNRYHAKARKWPPGFFRFKKNREARMAEGAAVLSLIMIAASFVFKLQKMYILYPTLTVLMISINMHGYFNGINYYYINKNRKV